VQRHPAPPPLAVALRPIRFGEHALVLPTAWEQPLIDLPIRQIRHVVPAQTGRISGLEDFGDAVPRDLLRRRDQPARQALGAQLQHPLGLDLPYHQYLLLPPGARYTQRKEPKKVALITNTVGSEPVHRQERTPALNADTAGAQKTEYSVCAGEVVQGWVRDVMDPAPPERNLHGETPVRWLC